jgi:hypothetical protein
MIPGRESVVTTLRRVRSSAVGMAGPVALLPVVAAPTKVVNRKGKT